jgi:hypothetical protein
MPTRKVPQRESAVSDAGAMRQLSLGKTTFFKYLKTGMPVPEPVPGTARRWWTEGDLELAREFLAERERKGA